MRLQLVQMFREVLVPERGQGVVQVGRCGERDDVVLLVGFGGVRCVIGAADVGFASVGA